MNNLQKKMTVSITYDPTSLRHQAAIKKSANNFDTLLQNLKNSRLILDYSVDRGTLLGNYRLDKEKPLKLKYCPMCGKQCDDFFASNEIGAFVCMQCAEAASNGVQ